MPECFVPGGSWLLHSAGNHPIYEERNVYRQTGFQLRNRYFVESDQITVESSIYTALVALLPLRFALALALLFGSATDQSFTILISRYNKL